MTLSNGGCLRFSRTCHAELAITLLLACSGKGSQTDVESGGGSKLNPAPRPAPADSPAVAAVHPPWYMKELMRGYYQDVLSRGKPLRDSYLAPDYIGHFAGVSEQLSRETWSQWLKELRQAFPDLKFTVEDMIVEGDRITTRYTMRGTHRGALRWLPPTGRPITLTGISIERVKGEQIAESWNQSDALFLWQQVGVVPNPVAPATQFEFTPVRFLSPNLYTPQVPERIRSALQGRGCRIPQWLRDTVPGNIVRGTFTTANRVDWAALCTRVRTDILVFRPDSTVDSLPGSMDNSLGTAHPDYIIQHLEWYGQDSSEASLEGKADSLSRVITHEGIEESDAHCCSTVHYWDGRRWVNYPGAD